MGGGSWTRDAFTSYSMSMGRDIDLSTGKLSDLYSAQDIYKAHKLNSVLDPRGVMRECCDSQEHPNTIPVILALDVTGSMGDAAAQCAKCLSVIMSDIYDSVQDVEFMIMGIGDLEWDSAPIQISQFESDIRIADQLDKIWFEAGGGGNQYESYTAAWYMGLNHTSLDCWKRGKKGIIITLGDEPLNPYLPKIKLMACTGDNLQADVETTELYKDVIKKFDVYHLAVKDDETCYNRHAGRISKSFGDLLGDHLKVVTINELPAVIVDIVKGQAAMNGDTIPALSNEISW